MSSDSVPEGLGTVALHRIKVQLEGCLELGLGLILDDSNTITDLKPGGQAGLDQLRVGDVVLSVDGALLNGESLQHVLRPGPTHVLEVERSLGGHCRRLGDQGAATDDTPLSALPITLSSGGSTSTGDSAQSRARASRSFWSMVSGSHLKKATGSQIAFLVNYFPDEWANFVNRVCHYASTHDSTDSNSSKNASRLQQLRRWGSMRLQTMYRTVAGMGKNRTAIHLLLSEQLPAASVGDLQQLTALKFTCLAAMQRYGVMGADELADVEQMFSDLPGLSVAFIEEAVQADGGIRFSSCVVDTSCAMDPDGSGRRVPRHRIALPGHPILGNGKSDNQNHAIIFTRGPIIQAIDANQAGYLEEALKLPSALREFEPSGDGKPTPTIVGFREHIFSGLGSLGAMAAGSELCFGTLVQRTMAGTLQSRYHYGHPDMLDKLAMMAQGGISKATRGLNLSEDVFAGMDAMLRGRTVVHREYYQVGKGRDMGSTSILAFFSKLSSGTAQMSTSRQAFRLGKRLGLGRLMGFYYAHVGYYVGQLHFFHSSHGLLALLLAGALVEGVGVLPVAAACAELANTVFGLLFTLFFVATLVPLSLCLLAEDGSYEALMEPLRQLLSGSPLFFVLQSKCIGYYISGEFATGGASYVATGRSLAIEHQPFHELYAAFAAISLYAGVELVLFLVLPSVLVPSLEILLPTYIFGALTPAALLFTPFLFNPNAFSLAHQRRDLLAWAAWLTAPPTAKASWLGHHASLCGKKVGSALHATLLPSKELLCALFLMLLTSETMRPRGWGAAQLALLALPAFATAAMALLLCALWLVASIRTARTSKADTPPPPPKWLPRERSASMLAAAVVCVASLAGEAAWLMCGLPSFLPSLAGDAVWLELHQPGLPAAYVILLLLTRYFSWRFVLNLVTYFVASFGASGSSPAAGLVKPLAPFRVVHAACELASATVGAHAFAGDVLLGLLLQLPLFLLALLPLSTAAHFFCLFRVSDQTLARSADQASRKHESLASLDEASRTKFERVQATAVEAITRPLRSWSRRGQFRHRSKEQTAQI